MEKALKYSLSNEVELRTFLVDGNNIPMTNSTAERTIRKCAIGRNNWLFSGSPRGAKACDVLYSIVESAKANGLSPYKYVFYILEKLSSKIDRITKERIEPLLPWKED